MKNYRTRTKYMIKPKLTQKKVELSMEFKVSRITNHNSLIITKNNCHKNKFLKKKISKPVKLICKCLKVEIFFK
jgi:hypothetical protein